MENEELENTASDSAKPEEASPDLSAYYAAAAKAASSGHVYGPEEENGKNDPSGSLSESSPHGPIPELQDDGGDDSDDGQEENGEKAVPAPAGESSPPAPVPAGDPQDDEDEEEGAEDDVNMGLLGHANELRRRLMKILIILLLGWIGLFSVAEPMYSFLAAPLQAAMPEGSKMIYTSPQGMFFTYLKVAAIASLFFTSPLTFYQAWAFIAPGLYREEKRTLLPLAFCSSILFVGGAAFCFCIVFPIAFKFFMGFATAEIQPMISVEEYLSFALKILIAFGIVFEMPLFSFFLARFGILSPGFMKKSRPYAIILIFVLAAILTPPDVISQILMSIPMLLLYEISIYVCAAAFNKEKAALKQQRKENNE